MSETKIQGIDWKKSYTVYWNTVVAVLGAAEIAVASMQKAGVAWTALGAIAVFISTVTIFVRSLPQPVPDVEEKKTP